MLADVHPHIVWSLDPAPLIPVALFAYLYTRRFVTVVLNCVDVPDAPKVV